MKARVALVGGLISVLVGACSSEPTTSRDTADPAPSPAAAESAAAVTPAAQATVAIDVSLLPAGPPPRVDYLGDGRLRWHGRTTSTDFPSEAVSAEILGSVGGRPVLTAYQEAGSASGERFWAIDEDGSARRLGGTYRSYDYTPRLVASTGHLWVHFSDRTSPRTIWELDARTGREIATYADNRVPQGLAAPDQALVDAWVDRRRAVPDTEARTRDGALVARTRSAVLATGTGETVLVRRTSDRTVVGRFTFPVSVGGGVARVVFEDGDHVLVLTTVSFTRRQGPQQAIVRCSLSLATCERTTEIAGNMALGVVHARFVPSARP